jgi:hypothetical protein
VIGTSFGSSHVGRNTPGDRETKGDPYSFSAALSLPSRS